MSESVEKNNVIRPKQRRLLTFMMSVVVFVTTYALILPAVTLEQDKAGPNNNYGIALEDTQAQNIQQSSTTDTPATSEQSSSAPTSTEQNQTTANQDAPKELPLITKATTLTHQGGNYTVTASFDAGARLPVGVELVVSEIAQTDTNYATYQSAVEEMFYSEAGNDLSYLQLFDIHFAYDGKEYQPAEEVDIQIEYQDGPATQDSDSFHIVHFTGDNQPEVFESESTSTATLENIAVSTSTFSVYGVARSTNSAPITIGDKTYYTVKFIYQNSAGETKSSIILVENLPNATVGTLPQDPFIEGKRFVKWVNAATGEVVGTSTPVQGNMEVNAVFEEIEQYEVVVDYIYFNNARQQDVIFDTEIYKLAEYDLPYEIKTPASSVVKKTDDSSLANDAIYYPETKLITLQNQASLDAQDAADGTVDRKIHIKHRYGPTDSVFYYVYKLKNLHDNNYSDIKRVQARGLVGSTVTAPIEIIPYAVFERTEATEINYEEGQEIPVYYRRGNAKVTYESNGGTYVPRQIGTYGTEETLPKDPIKTGYTFGGWYEDAGLTKRVTSDNVVLDKDKTLYAKWNPAEVKYTILYYRYEYDQNDYIGITTHEQGEAVQPREKFIGSVETEGVTGSTIYANAMADYTGIDDNTGQLYTLGYQKMASKNNSSAVVNADGTTVIKVYYEPKTYTYKFNTDRNDASITHMGVNKGRTYSFTAKTGQYIAQKWPVNWPGTNRTVTSTANGYSFIRWAYAGTNNGSITMQQFASAEHISKANANNEISYYAMWTTGNELIYTKAANGRPGDTAKYGTARVNYYFENSAQPGVYERQPLQSEDIATFDKLSNIAAKGFTGYQELNDAELRALPSSYPRTRQASKPVQNGSRLVGRTNYPTYPEPPLRTQTDNYNGKTYDRIFEFYYKINRYNVEYKYNAAANHIPKGSAEDVLVSTKSSIINGTNINTAEYNFVPPRPAGVDSDYTWGGWYEDEKLLSPAFRGTGTIPLTANKVLYAKWIPPKFTVNFQLGDATTPTSLPSQQVDKYTVISVPPTPTKHFHAFEGWYTAAQGGTEFDFNEPITQNTTVYARWKLLPIEYTVRYIDITTNQPILGDKHIQGQDLSVGQEISEEAVAVPGYRPQELNQTLSLTDNFDNNVITFYYDKRNNNLTYTVDYVLQSDPTKKVATSKVEVAGATVIKVRELAKAVDKAVMQASGITGVALLKDYYPVNQSEELVISSNVAHNRIVFEYVDRDTAIIEINYLDMDGNPIPGHDKRIEALNAPNVLDTVVYRKAIYGFTYDKTVDGNKVENKQHYIFNQGSKLVLNYYYKKNLTLTPRSDQKVYDGRPLQLVDGNANDVIVSTDTPLARNHLINVVTFQNKSITNVGEVTPSIGRVKIVNAQNVDKTNYYNITFQTGKLKVTPKPITVTVRGERKTVMYDGQTHQVGYTITSSDPNFDVANPANLSMGTITPIAEKYVERYELKLQKLGLNNEDNNKNKNYTITFNVIDGFLHITKRPATITSRNLTKTYTGANQTGDADAVDYTGFVNNEHQTIVITPDGGRTTPGTIENHFTFTADNLALLNRNYAISSAYGTLEILPVVNLQKTDDAWTPLAGARFELYRYNGTVWESVPAYNNISVDEAGSDLAGLTKGRYRLKEIQAPAGYIVLTKYLYFDVVGDTDYQINLVNGTDGLDTSKMRLRDADGTYSHRIQAINQPGAELPDTGGAGTQSYTMIGFFLIALVSFRYLTDKKKKTQLA